MLPSVRARTSSARRLVPTLLVALTLAPGLLPAGTAQSSIPGGSSTIRFDHEPAEYLEGEKVVITLGVDPGLTARIRCLTCPDKDKAYEAPTQGQLIFPDDFGADATTERQPKWNDTWIVELVLGETIVQERTFNVWAANLFAFPDRAPRPSNLILVQVAGYTPGDMVQLVLRHRKGDGTLEVRFAADAAVNFLGRASYYWRVPLDEAQRVACPLRPKGFCEHYELSVKGPGKVDELMKFKIKPATLDVRIHSGDATQGTTTLDRTTNVTVNLDIKYPEGPRLAQEHVTGPRSPDGTLLVRVERRESENAGVEPVVVANVSAFFDDARDLWIARWTIPRDESTDVSRTYSFVLAEQKDRWGNVVPEEHLNEFKVQAATLTPTIVLLPREVERTAEVKVVLSFKYHDGSSFTPNDTQEGDLPDGCFLPDDPGPNTCQNGGMAARVRYWEGPKWNFTGRYPVDYADLSRHQFRYEGGVVQGQDKYGNRFQTINSALFDVIAASIRINLTTVVGSELRTEERGFDRGDVVAVTANLTYPDGSAFNTTMNENSQPILRVLVTKLGEDGGIAGEEDLNLTNTERQSSFWHGTLRVSRDASLAPIGRWRFTFHVRDNVTPPNGNDTDFHRAVNPAEIAVVPTKEPPRTVPIGSLVTWKFQLVYEDGAYVTSSEVGTSITVRAERASGPRAGSPVSGPLLPTYDPARKEWTVEWEVPRVLFSGSYAFKPFGEDRHGNVLDRDATSRTFATFTDATVRAVLTEPPTRVERGSSMIVVFDGRDGDVAPTGFPRTAPVIELQRFDPFEQKWVVERRDVRARGEGDGDHIGRLNTTISTTLGLYRFHLRGRDASFNVVNGTTETFNLVPTNVSRPLLVPPPERVAKGQYVLWAIEREAGDQIGGTTVLFNGRPAGQNLLGGLAIAGPISQVSEDRWNFTWRVPYASETGNYSFTLRGFDAFQNNLLVDVPPVSAEPSILSGRVIGHPEKLVGRGSEARFLFAITYPNGDFFASRTQPRVLVVNETGLVATAGVESTGLAFQAAWTPSDTAPLDTFWFEVTGQDASGNVFPALRSDTFRIEPGESERAFVRQPKLSYQRLDTVTAELPARSGDGFAAFTLQYIGDQSLITDALVGGEGGTTVANLEHRLDASLGRYVVAWRTDRDERLGVYRIQFSGQDEFGNEVTARSEPFALQPTFLKAAIDPIPEDAFGPGKRIVFDFDLNYQTLSPRPADPAATQPEAVILWESRAVAQRPEIAFDPTTQRWTATWDAPEDLPNGQYALVISGQDEAGNEIRATPSQVMRQDTPVVTSFKRVLGIPDVSAPLGLVAVALVALALGGLSRRRD